MAKRSSSMRSDSYARESMRDYSPTLAYAIPYLSILLGSMIPAFALAGSMPFLPPLGFLLFFGWRIIRPGLLPMWVGLPLGAFDDLFSGQPFGSGILLWSIAMITIEFIEARWPWRGFWQDWVTYATATTLYLFLALIVSGTFVNLHHLVAIAPQVLLSVLLYPMIARMVATLDKLRLKRFKVIS